MKKSAHRSAVLEIEELMETLIQKLEANAQLPADCVFAQGINALLGAANDGQYGATG